MIIGDVYITLVMEWILLDKENKEHNRLVIIYSISLNILMLFIPIRGAEGTKMHM